MHLQMYRGDDAEFTITPTSTVSEGDDVVFTAKEFLADLDEDAVLEASTDGGTVEISEGGDVVVTIAAADTDGIDVRTRLYWDVQVISSGLVKTVARGALDILPDVTRTAVVGS